MFNKAWIQTHRYSPRFLRLLCWVGLAIKRTATDYDPATGVTAVLEMAYWHGEYYVISEVYMGIDNAKV